MINLVAPGERVINIDTQGLLDTVECKYMEENRRKTLSSTLHTLWERGRINVARVKDHVQRWEVLHKLVYYIAGSR